MKDLSNDIMIYKKSGDLEYLQFRKLLEYEDVLVHAFTTRIGGVSTGDNKSLNFSFLSDTRENVLKNYEIICCELGINIENIVCTWQKHGNNIEIVGKEHCGSGISKSHICDSYDGIITDQKNVILRTVSADCNLIILLDPIKKVLANIHAGWRGVVDKIVVKGVNMMKENFASNPLDIIACCAPSTGPCCFEFSECDLCHFNEYENIDGVIIDVNKQGKKHIDLWNIIELQLKSSGLVKENIQISRICTQCNNDVFYSHRADKGKTGRQILLAGLK